MIAYAVAAGAIGGIGIAAAVAVLLPSHVDLGTALGRLVPSSSVPVSTGRTVDGEPRSWQDVLGIRARRIAERVGLKLPTPDLNVLGLAPEQFLLTKLGLALTGLVVPPVLTGVAALLGVGLPLTLTGAVSLICAVALFAVPDLQVRHRAAQARRDFRRACCTYLDLIALERLSDAGATDALHRAASLGGGWTFSRIRQSLTRAELAGTSPWSALAELAEQVGVPELADIGDIVSLSGHDGAAIYTTLRARARSLRAAILAERARESNAASERLTVPAACLGLVFLALIAYPAFVRIVG